MKRQIKLTESELHSVIENAVNKIVSEYTDNEDDYMPYEDEEYGSFNEQPINTIVGENTKKHMKNIVKLTEGQLKAVIRESVNRVLNEIGDTPKGQYMLGKFVGDRVAKKQNTLNSTYPSGEAKMKDFKRHNDAADYASKYAIKQNKGKKSFGPNGESEEFAKGIEDSGNK